ncbi:unnamed protein product, partial [Staurois parvus]
VWGGWGGGGVDNFTCNIAEGHHIPGQTDNSWGPPGNRGSWGPCVLAQTQKSL